MIRVFGSRISQRAMTAIAGCPLYAGSRLQSSEAEDATKKESKKEPVPEVAENAPCPKTIKIVELEKQLKEATEKINELKSDLLYQVAETENVRRIGREDVDKARNFGIQSFGKDMLDVADTLEKGIEAFEKLPKADLEDNRAIASIYTGVKMSSNVLQKQLTKHGIEKMDVKVGEQFNPHIHEALFKTPVTDKVPADHISNILKPGYKLKDRVLRAAQVGVAE
jgi:molecular chaperone GrpE